jgi:coiled-coil domain-containing protein 130
MQGFNMGRYYPPDASNSPSFNTSSHPLGKRANKSSQGILIVRFELPFAVWCDHCTPAAVVGQGVRFNAEKKKVGKYYSTPIWSFRMKHSACGSWWEIRTDPKNADYIVVEGARKRDYGPEDKGAEAEGDLKFLTEEERERRRTDAFANLEGKIEDSGAEKRNKERVEELYEKSEVWSDPYDANARLRKDFRHQRKAWKREERRKEDLQNKFSLGLDIADETEVDRMRASIADYSSSRVDDKSYGDTAWKSLFQSPQNATTTKSMSGTAELRSVVKAEQSRKILQQTLVNNTKATIDPFLAHNANIKVKSTLGVLKRKRHDTQADAKMISPSSGADTTGQETLSAKPPDKSAPSAALVDYDSD